MRIAQLSDSVAQPKRDEWTAEQPRRAQQLLTPVEPNPVEHVHLGIFDSGELLAVVTLEARAQGIYEVHLALKRGLEVARLLPAFFSIRAQLFGELGVRLIIGWVPTLHRGIQKLAGQVGFSWQGVSMMQMVGKRLVEWRQIELRIN